MLYLFIERGLGFRARQSKTVLEGVANMVTFITYSSHAKRREAEKQWDIEKLMLQDTVHLRICLNTVPNAKFAESASGPKSRQKPPDFSVSPVTRLE